MTGMTDMTGSNFDGCVQTAVPSPGGRGDSQVKYIPLSDTISVQREWLHDLMSRLGGASENGSRPDAGKIADTLFALVESRRDASGAALTRDDIITAAVACGCRAPADE